VKDGVRPIADLVDRFNAISAEVGDPKDDTAFDALMDELGELQAKIDAVDGWSLDSQLEQAMEALRCPPGDADVTRLSGGEKRRVALCKLLLEKPDILLLDEPTNDLDVETLRALEEALETFAGCAVVISHDRFFLDRLCTHILAFEGDSHVEWFEGNYESYEEDKRRRMGDAADRPTRLAYKKLTR
ncbi:ATP-binding cassette domain-containing protein, partial [Staphylococcus aureus]|nr:ATP-binding cassette domain-containing protein [Staphylococcus aureus]